MTNTETTYWYDENGGLVGYLSVGSDWVYKTGQGLVGYFSEARHFYTRAGEWLGYLDEDGVNLFGEGGRWLGRLHPPIPLVNEKKVVPQKKRSSEAVKELHAMREQQRAKRRKKARQGQG
jgi:hypothetical protein